MTIDVVVVTHNSAAHLGRRSAARSGAGSSVVVVDNASSDGSVARGRRSSA